MKTTVCGAFLALSVLSLVADGQTTPSSPDSQYTVVERGANYRVWQATSHLTNHLTGAIVENVQVYTELENGIAYQDPQTGQWADSQDLIEITPTGAAATHGQTTAEFSPNLNVAGAITVRSGGQAFRSHPIGLYYRDLTSGKVALIAAVQDTIGVLVPPNEVVYSNAFSGLRASIAHIYTHNAFDQSVVLLQSPPSPDTLAGFNPATARLEIWTALDQWPAPLEQRPATLKPGSNPQFDLVDHLLFFADMWFPVGAAFVSDDSTAPAPGRPAKIRVVDPSDTNNVLVAKSLVRIGNQAVLVESANYQDLLPKLKTLQQAALSVDHAGSNRGLAQGLGLPAPGATSPTRRPLRVASHENAPNGLVIDYLSLSGSASGFTFTNNFTYVISNSFTVNGTSTFQTNSTIKFMSNAWLIANGQVSFPSSGWPIVFTSADDNTYGETIAGHTSGLANYAAKQELWFYYPTLSTTVQSSRFRWAQQGVYYNATSGQNISQYINSSSFENDSTPIYVDMPGSTLFLSGDTTCNTRYSVSKTYNTTVSGSLSVNCGLANASKMLLTIV